MLYKAEGDRNAKGCKRDRTKQRWTGSKKDVHGKRNGNHKEKDIEKINNEREYKGSCPVRVKNAGCQSGTRTKGFPSRYQNRERQPTKMAAGTRYGNNLHSLEDGYIKKQGQSASAAAPTPALQEQTIAAGWIT